MIQNNGQWINRRQLASLFYLLFSIFLLNKRNWKSAIFSHRCALDTGLKQPSGWRKQLKKESPAPNLNVICSHRFRRWLHLITRCYTAARWFEVTLLRLPCAAISARTATNNNHLFYNLKHFIDHAKAARNILSITDLPSSIIHFDTAGPFRLAWRCRTRMIREPTKQPDSA